MKKIAIFNNKGGVGKSTSVINLAYSISKNGKKVLVVDCDQQENCFMFFMAGQSAGGILPTAYKRIWLTTWTRYVDLSDMDTADFDYILFDLPPALTDEVRAILRHSGKVYVPTMLGEFEIAGLERVTTEIVKQNAQLGGIFITMYQKQNDEELLSEFRTALASQLMETVIPYSRTVRESQKAGKPIELYFKERKVPRSGTSYKIVDAYESLAEEIMAH